MSNRKKIENFCKKRNWEIKSLDYIRNRDAAYGDTWDASWWNLILIIDDKEIELETDVGYNRIAESVDKFLEKLEEYVTFELEED